MWALSGGSRDAATSSSVLCNLTGVPGTVIPEGSTAKLDTAGAEVFASTSSVTLDTEGLASVYFASVIKGPVQALPNTLNEIDSGPLGWETITNPDAAVLGTLTEPDPTLRLLRRNTLALQGTALPEAITSALYIDDGVRSLTFRENVSWEPQTIDGVFMVPKSVYACIDGGTDEEAAMTLLSKKSAGADWNGNTEVMVTDPVSGQVYPVKFDRPDIIEVLARVYIRVGTNISNPEQVVKAAIVAYANGLLPDEPGFVVGGAVSPFELAGAVTTASPGIYVQKVEVSYADSVSWVVEELPIGIFEKAHIQLSSVTVFFV